MAKKKAHQGSPKTIIQSSPKKPRLDPVQRLLCRFYEPLLLLHTLNPTTGEHSQSRVSTQPSPQDLQGLRRRLLEDLAYFCDYEKGGETVTALAIEDQPQGLIFWFASNAKSGSKVREFLREILSDLRQFSKVIGTDQETLVADLAHKAIIFGRQRIKDYCSLLKRPLSKASKVLAPRESTKDRDLHLWLQNFHFDGEKFHELCQLSYNERKSSNMKYLAELSYETAQPSSKDSLCFLFRKIRHYIGRLGYHVRAAQTLAEAAIKMPHYFEDFEVRFCRGPLTPFQVPEADALTTLESIVGRMFANADKDACDCREKLTFLDDRFKVFERFLRAWNDKNFRPRVHCELILLEHFYSNQIAFAESDRFIGCSKPACYCCALYIRYHPGRFIEPTCHQNIWPNWRPPDTSYLPDGKGAPSHRNILNSVISHIRKDVINQISDRSNSTRWHPDSITGISSDLYLQDEGCASQEPGLEVDSDDDPDGGAPLQ